MVLLELPMGPTSPEFEEVLDRHPLLNTRSDPLTAVGPNPVRARTDRFLLHYTGCPEEITSGVINAPYVDSNGRSHDWVERTGGSNPRFHQNLQEAVIARIIKKHPEKTATTAVERLLQSMVPLYSTGPEMVLDPAAYHKGRFIKTSDLAYIKGYKPDMGARST
jgi:hypothetical protein